MTKDLLAQYKGRRHNDSILAENRRDEMQMNTKSTFRLCSPYTFWKKTTWGQTKPKINKKTPEPLKPAEWKPSRPKDPKKIDNRFYSNHTFPSTTASLALANLAFFDMPAACLRCFLVEGAPSVVDIGVAAPEGSADASSNCPSPVNVRVSLLYFHSLL
jgi:hypothetical protein